MAKKPENSGKAWTKEQVKALEKQIKQNTPTPLIAHKQGRTEDSVRAKAKEINKSLKPTNKSPYGGADSIKKKKK